MLKKSILIIFLYILSSCKKDDSIQDDYISKIEQEYQKSGSDNIIIESDNNQYLPSGNNFYVDSSYNSTNNNDYYRNNNIYVDNNSYNESPTYSRATTTNSKLPYNKLPHAKLTVNNFYSPWTSKNDPKIIKEIRVMIANKEYKKAKVYIDNLDLDNLPTDVDLGQIYQFKGIVHYFLFKIKKDKINITIADKAFKSVIDNTQIEKFKPLSLLWNGMLYQTYSKDTTELEKAVDLFDRVINEYPRTRFANDATFYKAITLKKLGKPEMEYKDLLLSIKRGGFTDTLIYSQKVNDYVQANVLVDKEIN